MYLIPSTPSQGSVDLLQIFKNGTHTAIPKQPCTSWYSLPHNAGSRDLDLGSHPGTKIISIGNIIWVGRRVKCMLGCYASKYRVYIQRNHKLPSTCPFSQAKTYCPEFLLKYGRLGWVNPEAKSKRSDCSR